MNKKGNFSLLTKVLFFVIILLVLLSLVAMWFSDDLADVMFGWMDFNPPDGNPIQQNANVVRNQAYNEFARLFDEIAQISKDKNNDICIGALTPLSDVTFSHNFSTKLEQTNVPQNNVVSQILMQTRVDRTDPDNPVIIPDNPHLKKEFDTNTINLCVLHKEANVKKFMDEVKKLNNPNGNLNALTGTYAEEVSEIRFTGSEKMKFVNNGVPRDAEIYPSKVNGKWLALKVKEFVCFIPIEKDGFFLSDSLATCDDFSNGYLESSCIDQKNDEIFKAIYAGKIPVCAGSESSFVR